MARPAPFRCRVALAFETPAGRRVLAGIVPVARQKGWTLVPDDAAADGTITDAVAGPVLAAFAADGPVVRVGVRGVADVYTDEAAAVRIAVEHLLDRGFRHLARTGLTLGAAAFDAAVFARGHATAHTLPFTTPLTDLPRPRGVVAGSDAIAAGVVRRAADAGLNVPRDVAVVGCGNDAAVCELAGVPLTSIDPDAAGLGRRAALRLDALRRGRVPAGPEAVPPLGLVARGSTDTLAVADADLALALRVLTDAGAVTVRVADLVRASGLDRRTLERRFRAALGRSPAEAIRRHRAGRAAELLRSTTLPVAEIARQTGFRLPQHLAMTLKAVYGQTPTDLRASRTDD